jgi:6-phosphogluconolactonase
MIMKHTILILNVILLTVICSCSEKGKISLYTGTFAKEGEKGFYLYDFDINKGTLALKSVSDAGPEPSYFCISSKYGMIYTANEVSEFMGRRSGGVTAIRFNEKTGEFQKTGELAVPEGGPCYISLAPGGDYLLMANYGSSSVAVVKLNSRGLPESVTDTVIYADVEGKQSHPHMIASDPAGKKVYVTDLGLDRIVMYSFDPGSGQLQSIPDGIFKVRAGAGPRHFAFNHDGTILYVINELNSTISVFNVNSEGGLNMIQTVNALREGFTGESFCADIHISKNGRFLYGSNRGENSIVTFSIAGDGKLTLAGHTSCGGDWPRNFVIDPSGRYILVGNEHSGNISVFKIDEKRGIPAEPGISYKIKAPACLRFPD